MIYATLIVCAITITASIAAQSPQSASSATTENKASADKPAVEILSHRIGPEYYPMLDRKSGLAPPTAAETGDLPRTVNDPMLSDSRFEVHPQERREAGRLRSPSPRVASHPQVIQVVIKNTSAKSIKAVEWDFLFPHCMNGQFFWRYYLTTTAKIKPGGKKTLKSRLSQDATNCPIPKGASAYLPKRGRISIKRIEYEDGSVWQRQ